MRRLLGGLVGGTLGFAISAAVYLRVNPMLEAATGPVRELQGLLWNVVPLTTAAGFVLGLWVMSRHPPRPGRGHSLGLRAARHGERRSGDPVP